MGEIFFPHSVTMATDECSKHLSLGPESVNTYYKLLPQGLGEIQPLQVVITEILYPIHGLFSFWGDGYTYFN